MADFATSFDTPMIKLAASSSSASAVDDSFEDVCSICLDPFSTGDPSNVTSCKHEYHLQCIIEWSQRSKECPICWQDLSLKDPSSQELLAAVENERTFRERRLSPNASTIVPNFYEDSDIDHDASYSADFDFDERIMQHLAAAASRARYVCRRGRHRSSGLNPTQVLFVAPSVDMPDEDQTRTSPEERQSSGYGIVVGDSSNSNIPSTITFQPPLPVDPFVGNTVSISAANSDGPFKQRIFCSQSPPDSPRRSIPNELSFSESMKLRLSAASSRCKESIAKGTWGFKEKLLARNNSMKELSKGVQREMNAGIAGVAKVLERLDLTSKGSGSSVSDSSCTAKTSNISLKGKNVQDNVFAQSQNGNEGEVPHDISSSFPSYVCTTIPGRVEVSPAQNGQ